MFHATDYDKLQQIMAESPEKKELLTRLLESQKMTISMIGHEIRNPLTLVYSTLQLIESQHPEVLTYKHWSGMKSDVEYMTQLLEELSAYNNGERLNISSIETNTFLKTIALSFAASIVDTDIEFTSKIQPDLPVISGDTVKLRQVLLNLLTNAKDAVTQMSESASKNAMTQMSESVSKDTTPYQPSIRLEVQLENPESIPSSIYTNASASNDADAHSKQILHIYITDNGCGISEEDLPGIFEPFVTHKSGGTGLGLAIAKRIAAAHSGTLSAESTPGKGTLFHLSLPV